MKLTDLINLDSIVRTGLMSIQPCLRVAELRGGGSVRLVIEVAVASRASSAVTSVSISFHNSSSAAVGDIFGSSAALHTVVRTYFACCDAVRLLGVGSHPWSQKRLLATPSPW